MGEALRSAFRTLLTARYVALWAICSVLLSLAGPFGTYQEYPYSLKLPYWFLVVSISSILGHSSIILCKHWLNPRRPFQIDVAATMLMSTLFTPILYGLTQSMLIVEPETGPALLQMFIYVVPISFAVYTTRRLIPGLDEHSYVYATDPTQTPRLVRRLPEEPDHRIIRLSSDDHLVEVVTQASSYRIRMRLTDAIDEMDGIEGFWTHRSHWVTRSAMTSTVRENGRVYIRLVNGDKIPVSRKYKPQLEEVGLI